MAKKIVIDADLRKVSESFKKTFKEIEKIAPKKMGMGFDFETLKKWKSSNVDAYKTAAAGIEQAKARMKELAALQMEMAKSGKSAGKELSDGFKQASGEAQKYAKQIADIQRSAKGANFFQRLGAQFRTQSQSSGGVKGAAEDAVGSAMGGLGDAASMMGGPWGKLAGLGVGAYMGARALAAPRRALANQNLEMAGLHNKPLSDSDLGDMRRSGITEGFSGEETMRSGISLQRQAGEVDASALHRFSQLRRQTGLGSEELTGMTESLRGAAVDKKGIGVEDNLNKLGKIYQQATQSALDKSGALKYLSVTAGLTDKIANEGSADVDSIKDTLSTLAMQSDFYKANPARAAAALQGGEDFFKSDQGTGLALRSMQSMGALDGKGPMESLMMQQMGFTEGGFDVGKHHFQGVGGKGLQENVRQTAEAGSGLTKENFSKASDEQIAAATMAIAKTMGLTPSNAGKLLETSMTGKDLSKKDLDEMMQTPVDKTNSLLDKGIAQNDASFHEVILTLGEKIAGPMTAIEGQVTKIANKMLGVGGPQSTREYNEKIASQKQAIALKKASGDESLWDKAKNAMGMGDQDDLNSTMKDAARQAIKQGDVMDSDSANSLYNSIDSPYVKGLAGKDKSKLAGGSYLPSEEGSIYTELQNATKTRNQVQSNMDSQRKDGKSDKDLAAEAALVTKFNDLIKTLTDALNAKADKSFLQSVGMRGK